MAKCCTRQLKSLTRALSSSVVWRCCGSHLACCPAAPQPRRRHHFMARRRRRKNALSPPLHSALFSIRLPTLPPPRYATLSAAQPRLALAPILLRRRLAICHCAARAASAASGLSDTIAKSAHTCSLEAGHSTEICTYKDDVRNS